MGYVAIVLLVVAVIGAVGYVMLRASRSSDSPSSDGQVGVTERADMPVHPDEPVPGSETRRHRQGKP